MNGKHFLNGTIFSALEWQVIDASEARVQVEGHLHDRADPNLRTGWGWGRAPTSAAGLSLYPP